MNLRPVLLIPVLLLACQGESPSQGTASTAAPESPQEPVEQQEYLILHPDNSHYFQNTITKEAVLVTSINSLVPTARDFDDIYNLDVEIIGRFLTYVRVWHLLTGGGENAIWPWLRGSQPGAAMDGGNKFDLETSNPEYWQRMHQSLSKATDNGITAEIMIFNRIGLSASPTRWGENPWASDNNSNGTEVPLASGKGIPDFYDYENKPVLRKTQELYVSKMIKETSKYNVIYEIENEHWEYPNPKFADYFGTFIKDRLPANSRRLVSYSSLDDDLEAFYTLNSVDVINRHFGKAAEDDPSQINQYIESRWHFGKPINIDEFANGCKDYYKLRQMAWIAITSGGHFHIEDANSKSQPFDVVENIRRFKLESKWNFVKAAPNNRLSSTGYCMAQPGVEYVCYYAASGRKRLDVPAGTYIVRWWNPRGASGGFTSQTQVVHGGGTLVIDAPSTDDWVLQIVKP